jgi:hypothetical protein
VLEAIERICELFRHVADGANRKIDRPHASRNPQNAVRDIVLLRETSDGQERVGGEHAQLPTRARINLARYVEPVT